MEDYGIKVLKQNTPTVTDKTKKNFTLLNTTDADKIIFAGFVTGGSYDHNLNRIPDYFAFQVDSAGTPSVFTATNSARVTSSQITNLPNPAYLIILQ